MANFRMIYDNAANRAALSVSSYASASLGVANLTTDLKSQVWRTTGTSGVITATWATAQLLGGVALPYANLSATATVRVQLYTNVADASPAYDSGAVLCCPTAVFNLQAWGSDIPGVNAYGYGGASCGRLWFTHVSARKLVVTITDSSNTAGYIEVGRLVAGRFWEGVRNLDYGGAVSVVDTTKNFRNDAGDLLSDIGTRHRKASFSLSNLSQAERNVLWNILWGNGMSAPVFLSMYPDSADTALEQSSQIYCKLMNSPAMTSPTFLQYASTLEMEEV